MKILAEAVKNLSEKLQAIDIYRKFAIGMTAGSDSLHTLRKNVTHITLPFDSRKSGKFQGIDRRSIVMSMSIYGRGLLLLFCRFGFYQSLREQNNGVCSRLFIYNI